MNALLAPWLADPVVWAVAGAALLLAELLAPGFLLLGLGLGALVMAALAFAAPGAMPAALLSVLLWAAVSLAAWWALSRLFGRRARARRDDRDINDFENH